MVGVLADVEDIGVQGNTGDGIRWGVELGAVIVNLEGERFARYLPGNGLLTALGFGLIAGEHATTAIQGRTR